MGKGRLDESGRINVLEDFHEDGKFIEFLDYYGGRRFFPDEVELVVNGDFFELLVVDEHDLLTNRETEQTALWKIRKVFEGHKKIFDALWTFSARPNNRVIFLTGNHEYISHSVVKNNSPGRIRTAVAGFPRFQIVRLHIRTLQQLW